MRTTNNRNHAKGRSMATKTKPRSQLEIAHEEKAELEHRLIKARDSRDTIERELQMLSDQRFDPSASDGGGAQRRRIELRQLLEDETNSISGLEDQIEKREKMIKQLEHDTAKQDVAFQCRVAEAHFQQVMDALAGHLPEMRGWLADASTAHSRYASVNQSQNETLKEKMAILGYLVEYISNQPRRYI